MNEERVKIIGRKGGNILLYNGYQFYKHKSHKNTPTSLWICSKKRKDKCSGSLTVNNDKLEVLRQHEHSCVQNLLQNEKAIALNDIKEAAQNTDAPIPELYDEALDMWQKKGYDLITPLPAFKNSKHSFYDSRNKSAGVNKLHFKVFDEVQIPVQHLQYIVADYYDGDTKIVIFCMEKDRHYINEVTEIFGDGTFKSAPSPFAQLFVILGEFGSTITTTNVKPLLYALLSDKTNETYVKMFHLIKSQFPNWQPRKYHGDFELAALNAVQDVFPEIMVVGCYYHWSKSMWRKARQVFGKKKSKSAKRLVGLCSVLPLLPKEYLQSDWHYIKLEYNSTVDKKIKKFVLYLGSHWLTKDIQYVLSVYANRHRTNNVCESWNCKINKKITKKTINILRLLNHLEKLTTFTLNSQVKPRERLQIDNDDFIREVQMELIAGDITVGYALEKLR